MFCHLSGVSNRVNARSFSKDFVAKIHVSLRKHTNAVKNQVDIFLGSGLYYTLEKKKLVFVFKGYANYDNHLGI